MEKAVSSGSTVPTDKSGYPKNLWSFQTEVFIKCEEEIRERENQHTPWFMWFIHVVHSCGSFMWFIA